MNTRCWEGDSNEYQLPSCLACKHPESFQLTAVENKMLDQLGQNWPNPFGSKPELAVCGEISPLETGNIRRLGTL